MSAPLLPTVLQLGQYPWTEAAYQRYLNGVGSILQLESPEAMLDSHFAGAKLQVKGLLCGIHHKLSEAHFERLSDLRVVSNYGAGLDHLPLAYLRERGIQVCNTPDPLAEATADLTMGLILAVQRRFVPGQRGLRAGEFSGWTPFYSVAPGVDRGKTLGLIGCGSIGKAVARRAKPFGLKVVYTKRTRLSQAEEADLAVTYLPLEALLAQSDIVSLHCPLTEETRHLMNAERLAMMKPGASLINTSRGPVVDEAALVDALKQGRLHGAGLDVFEQEPQVHPDLWACENVVLLPHLGSATTPTREAMGDQALANLLEALGV